MALFSVTERVPRNHFRPKRIRPENILKFSDSGLRTVRVADRLRSAQAGGGAEIQQGRTERPSIRWVCHLDPRVDQSRVVEAVLSGAVVLGDGGQGVLHRYLTM